MVAFGCVVSRSVEGAALGLHIFCGARSCIFGFVGGVSSSSCGCELFLVGVVFDVALRVGVIFLLNLVSPVQLSPSSLPCSSCLESCLGVSCSCSCSCPCLLMMVSRQSSSSSSGIGQPLLRGADGVVTIKFPVVSVSTKDLSQSLVCVCVCNLFLLLFCFLCRLNHSNGFSIVCTHWVDVESCRDVDLFCP